MPRPSRLGCLVVNRSDLAGTIFIGSFQLRDRSDSGGGGQTSESTPENHRGFKAGIPSGNGLIRQAWAHFSCLKLGGNGKLTGAHVGVSKLSPPWITAWGEQGWVGNLDSGSWDASRALEAPCAVTPEMVWCAGLDRAQHPWEIPVDPTTAAPLARPSPRRPWQWATQNDWDTSHTQSTIAARTRECLGR